MKIAIFIIITLVLAVAGFNHFFPLDAPLYFDVDGATLWKRQMSSERGKNAPYYLTRYNVYWNGVGFRTDNRLVAESRWVEFILWNKDGIEDIKVYALGQSGPQLIYPSEENVRQARSPDGSIQIYGEQISVDKYNRYVVFGVKPLADTTYLRITVTDRMGNITKDVIPLSSIRNPFVKKS